jgi:hypothetical protein
MVVFGSWSYIRDSQYLTESIAKGLHRRLMRLGAPVDMLTPNSASIMIHGQTPGIPGSGIHWESKMKIDGHCHCGEIAFEAEVDPQALNICHCTDCQTLSGSAFRANIQAPAENFVLRGKPKTYIKIAESGNKRLHAFCGTCGTPIYACAVDNPQVYGLRAGTITQRAAFSPRRQGWRRSALPWVNELATVAAVEKGRKAGPIL